MQHYQFIKGAKNSFYDGQNRGVDSDAQPLSLDKNQMQASGDFAANGSKNIVTATGMLNSIENMRDEYLHELPKSINIHSNSVSGVKPGVKGPQAMHDFSFKEQKNKPIPAGKPRIETLPSGVLTDICKYLKPTETVRLTMTTKQIHKKA